MTIIRASSDVSLVWMAKQTGSGSTTLTLPGHMQEPSPSEAQEWDFGLK